MAKRANTLKRDLETIGGRLAFAINDIGMSSSYAIARATGLSESTISRIIRNKTTPNYNTIRAIGLQVGVNPEWILRGGDDSVRMTPEDILFFEKHPDYVPYLQDKLIKLETSNKEFQSIENSTEFVEATKKEGPWTEEGLKDHLKKRDEISEYHDRRIQEHRERLQSREKLKRELLEELSFDQLVYTLQTKYKRHLIACPFVSNYNHENYINGIGSPEYLKKLPKHVVLIEKFTPDNFVAFEIKEDEEMKGQVDTLHKTDQNNFVAGDIIIGRKVDHLHPNFWFDVHKYRGMTVVIKSKIMTFITTPEAIKEGLRTFKFEDLLFKQTGVAVHPEDVLEVFEIVHLARYY